jgi:uracil-DNA glycosylase family 4
VESVDTTGATAAGVRNVDSGGAASTAKSLPLSASESTTLVGSSSTAAAARPGGELDPAAALQILQDEVCHCTKCPALVQNRTQTVFGVGTARPRLCFFGEGPGADEDRLGEPFVGAAGQLLNKMIAAMGVRREDVYILNVVKCRPPGNRTPTPEETENCRPFFVRQLEILKPEIICALGACAAHTLLQTESPVGELRGHLHAYQESKVVVTYHPAYLLRRPEEKGKTWSDLKIVMRELGLDVPG